VLTWSKDADGREVRMPRVRHWVALAATLLALGLALGFVAADTSLLTPRDLRLNHEIQTTARAGLLHTVMSHLTDTASPWFALVLTLLLVDWLLLRRAAARALATLLVIGSGCASVEIVKAIVARPGPPPGGGPNAYPSGHTGFAISFAVAAYFLARGTRWARLVLTLGAGWVALIAFSRLYLGAHYPTDVLGSAPVTAAAIVAASGVWHRWIAAPRPPGRNRNPCSGTSARGSDPQENSR
jgi:undecaprenyl-diphosphatase